MRRLTLFVFAIAAIITFGLTSASFTPDAQAAKRGKVIGGLAHQMPGWFKESFLDLAEDAQEADEAGKHVIMFMSLNGCPYCTKMLNKVFEGDKAFITRHFDSIGINIKGARMITPPGGEEMSEKMYAQSQRVIGTPTILFLDAKGKQIYRINGYWNPVMFRHALEYVQTKSYKTMKFFAFMKAKAKGPIYSFRAHPMLSKVTDFSKQSKPVAVLFEDKNCTACAKLHDKMLSRADIKKELSAFTFTRLDAYSKEPIIGIDGNKTTGDAWARKLNLGASPTIVVFDEGKERQRISAELYAFHFQYALRYVSSKSYKTHPNWIKYLGEQQERILKTGKNIDIGEQPAASQ